MARRDICAVLMALLLLCGCEGPSHDETLLRAIRTESDRLMAARPAKSPPGWTEIPGNEWPPAIASLHPFNVTVFEWGVDITTKPYFDGGWGYEIARSKNGLPMPAGCYSEPSPGVFWHGPC